MMQADISKARSSLEDMAKEHGNILSTATKFASRAFAFNSQLLWGDCLAAYDQSFLATFKVTHCICLAEESKVTEQLPLNLLISPQTQNPARIFCPLKKDFTREQELEVQSKLLEILSNPANIVYVHCIKGEERTPLIITNFLRDNPSDILKPNRIAYDILRDSAFSSLNPHIRPKNKDIHIVTQTQQAAKTYALLIGPIDGTKITTSTDITSINDTEAGLIISEFLRESAHGYIEGMNNSLRLASSLTEQSRALILLSALSSQSSATGSFYWEPWSGSLSEKVKDVLLNGYLKDTALSTIINLKTALNLDPDKVVLGHDY